MRPMLTSLHAVLLSGIALVPPALAHEERRTELFKPGVEHVGEGATAESGAPQRIEGLGSYGLTAAHASAEAQAWFEQGVGLLWGFNHAEAVRAFQAAQAADPDCAMCYWGEGYALGPNLNDGMHPENEVPALAAAHRAAGQARTPREAALGQALVLRYSPEIGDQAARNQAFADAISAAAAQFPDDANLQVLKADALMNLQPWDYWEADGITPKGKCAEILASLERAMELDPDHPAALHLYIHAVEASADPARGIAAADRLRGLTPGAGHLVHMPAHIYNRTGRFADSIAVNQAAIEADEVFLQGAGDAASPLYRFGYYPHNVHFLLVAAQNAGDKDAAIAAAEKLAGVVSDDVAGELAWVQAILTAPYSAHAQFSDIETIMALPDPGDRFPFVKGFWHYARGTALARAGEADLAWDEVYAIEEMLEKTDFSDLEAQYLPARDVLGIAKHVVEGRIEAEAANWHAAIHHLDEAIALEARIAYMEPPYWPYPVHQTLGAVLLQAGRPADAARAFETALADTPSNGWAAWGLWQAQATLFDLAASEVAEDAFRQAWLGDESLLSLDRL